MSDPMVTEEFGLMDYRNAPSGVGPLSNEWKDKPHRLIYDLATALATEREKTSQRWDARAELDRVSGLLDTERTARESLEKERDGLAAVLARVDDVIENWPNGDLDEDAAAMAKVEEIARGSDHATILAAHDARLTAPLERRVGELLGLLSEAYRLLNHSGMLTKHHRERLEAALASTSREGTEEPVHYVSGAIELGIYDQLAEQPADPPADREQASIADYEETLADHRRLVRELDVILNGEDGAAPQASLVDIVGQFSKPETISMLRRNREQVRREAFQDRVNDEIAAELRRLADSGGSGNA